MTVKSISQAVNRIVSESQTARDSGSTEWWRPLEACLACLGSISEGIIDYCNDEQSDGNSKPIDVEALLSDIIPQLLVLSGEELSCFKAFCYIHALRSRLPLLTGPQFRLRISVCEASSSPDGRPIHLRGHRCYGERKRRSPDQSLCCEGDTKVSYYIYLVDSSLIVRV